VRVINHGTESMYVRGCKCAECRKAHSEYNSERNKARRTRRLILTENDNRVARMMRLAESAANV
jgi:hypothetical protein